MSGSPQGCPDGPHDSIRREHGSTSHLQLSSLHDDGPELSDMAHGGAFKLGKARLASLGLDEKMTERIFKELANPNNVETVRGVLTSRKIRSSTDRWIDLEAREAFRNALYRSTRQMIQHNDIGTLAQWMSHPIGRVLVQFRRFIFGSFTNHLLYNANLLRKGDMRALSFFLTSTLFSGLSYSLWQQIKTIGMPNRQEVAWRSVSRPTELAKAVFSRSGCSSILPHAHGQWSLASHHRQPAVRLPNLRPASGRPLPATQRPASSTTSRALSMRSPTRSSTSEG